MNSHSNQNEGIRVLEEFVCQAIPDPSVLAPMSLKVEIDWPDVDPKDLMNELALALPSEHRGYVSLSVEAARTKPGTRAALEPPLIGATIQGGATVLAAFIYAWLTWPKPAKPTGASVVITAPDGSTSELPVNASPEQINELVSALKNAQKVRMKMKIRK